MSEQPAPCPPIRLSVSRFVDAARFDSESLPLPRIPDSRIPRHGMMHLLALTFVSGKDIQTSKQSAEPGSRSPIPNLQSPTPNPPISSPPNPQFEKFVQFVAAFPSSPTPQHVASISVAIPHCQSPQTMV